MILLKDQKSNICFSILNTNSFVYSVTTGMVVGWVHPWVGLGWVGFSYQNLYNFRYYNYKTDISLFTSRCSHLVFLAVVCI